MNRLTADQLAQYRGCTTANACYPDCCAIAQHRLANPVAALDPNELANAARWAARLDWPAPADPDTRHLEPGPPAAGADGETDGEDQAAPVAE